MLVVASRNAKKCRELEALLKPLGIEVRSVSSFEGVAEVEETGETFAENAALKATQVAAAVNQWTIGDDSGLMVDHLSGAPGVRSARYAGDGATDEQNCAKLLDELTGVPTGKRGAQFVCHLAVSDPGGTVRLTASGKCRGRIIADAAGAGGFGYDPLFLLPEYHRTFGQLSPIVKGVLSHRARAMSQLVRRLSAVLPSDAG